MMHFHVHLLFETYIPHVYSQSLPTVVTLYALFVVIISEIHVPPELQIVWIKISSNILYCIKARNT